MTDAILNYRPKTREEAERVCVFWGINDPEDLGAEDPDTAIAEHIESLLRDKWPETVSLHGFVRMTVEYKPGRRFGPLANILEALDEEYGDPDDNHDETKPTPKMEEAECAFIAAVVAEYKPWTCEEIYQEEVNVMEWVRANQPDWLEEPK